MFYFVTRLISMSTLVTSPFVIFEKRRIPHKLYGPRKKKRIWVCECLARNSWNFTPCLTSRKHNSWHLFSWYFQAICFAFFHAYEGGLLYMTMIYLILHDWTRNSLLVNAFGCCLGELEDNIWENCLCPPTVMNSLGTWLSCWMILMLNQMYYQ